MKFLLEMVVGTSTIRYVHTDLYAELLRLMVVTPLMFMYRNL